MKYLLLYGLILLSIRISSQELPKIVDSLSEEVVITHSRLPISAKQTAKKIEIISQEVVKQYAGQDLSTLLSDHVGVVINGARSNYGKDKSIFIRGAASEYTLILLDGVPISDPSGIGGAYDLRLIPLNVVKQIEIMKGSHSTIYGSDAIAGVINIVTHNNDQASQSFDTQLTAGSFETYNINAGYSGSLSDLSFRVRGGYGSSGGISEALAPDSNTEFESDGLITYNLNTGASYQFTDKLKLSYDLAISDFMGDFDDGSFADADNKYESSNVLNNARLSFKDDLNYSLLSFNHNLTDRSFESAFGLSLFKGRQNNLNFIYSRKLDNLWRLSAGLDYNHAKMIDDMSTVIDPSTHTLSPFATLLFNGANTLNAEIGVRLNSHSTFGENVNYSLSISKGLLELITLHASMATGFKAPNLFQLYGQFGANPDLKPQTSLNIEGGITFKTHNNHLTGGVTIFNRSIDNISLYDFTVGYFNQDEQQVSGIEIESTYKASKHLSFSSYYSYLNGHLNTKDESGQSIESFDLYRRPRHEFALSVRAQPTDKMWIGLKFRSVSSRSDLFFNPDNFFISEEVELDPYNIADLSLNYKLSELIKVYGSIRNLTNSEYSEVYGFSTIGTNWLVGLQLSLK